MEFEKTAATFGRGDNCGGGGGRFDSRRPFPAGFTVIKAHRAAIRAPQAECANTETAKRAQQRGQCASFGQPLRAEWQPERRNELPHGNQVIKHFRLAGIPTRALALPFLTVGGELPSILEDVEVKVGSLAEQDEREGN